MPEEFQILGMETLSYQYKKKKLMNVDSARCDFQRDKTPRGVAARFGKSHDLLQGEETLHHHSLFKVTSTMCIDPTRLAGGERKTCSSVMDVSFYLEVCLSLDEDRYGTED